MPQLSLKRRIRWTLFLTYPPLLALVACSQIPRSATPEDRFSSLTCPELVRELASDRTTKTVADRARGDAWQAVLPFIVAARYADADAASRQAQRRIDLLTTQASVRGCSR